MILYILLFICIRYAYIYYKTEKYLKHFLVNHHDSLGRHGPVCPFMPIAYKNNTLRIYYYPFIFDKHSIENIVKRNFLTIKPRSIYKACVLVFPDASTNNIIYVQEKLKDMIVSEGFMIGEFYPNHSQSGLHNKDFFPLDTYVPMIALRSMVRGDKLFLDSDKYTSSSRKTFMDYYYKYFSNPNKIFK